MNSRRRFLARAAPTIGVGLASLGARFPFLGIEDVWAASSLDEIVRAAPEARFWTSVAAAGADCGACHANAARVAGRPHRHAAGLVKCLLCARGCNILPGKSGRCRARYNDGGTLRSLVYGRPVAVHVDPIEKKPFYHFLPGAQAYSLATAGCPLSCKFCQNWEISQSSPEDHDASVVPAARVAAAAAESKAPVISFTYNEPTVFTEYMLDIARSAAKLGVRSTLVSCGFMSSAPLDAMCDVLAGIKIDLKGMSESFYRDMCGAALKPVLRSLKQISSRKVHLEIVNLVVPTHNDSEASLKELADWVMGELGPDVPLHFTRFHPDYQLLNLPPTPIATLERAHQIAVDRGLRFAYVGNVPGHRGNNTYCPSCRKPVIERSGFFVTANRLRNGRCQSCGHVIPGVWK